MRSVSQVVVFLCVLALTSARLFSQAAPSCTVTPTPSNGQAALPVSVGVACPTTNNGTAGYSSGKVDFGDGNVFAQTVGAAPPPSTFSIPHTYDRSGTFTVTVTATYSDSSMVTGTATVTVTALPAGPAPATGDIYVSGTAGTIERRNPNGALAQVLYIGVNDPIGGMGFDPTQLLHVTDATTSIGSASANVYVFDASGNPAAFSTFPATSADFLAHSIAFDKGGNSYVGVSLDGTPAIVELNSTGTILNTHNNITNDNSSSALPWLDLAFDQCTVFYTLGGTTVLRFNFCTNTQQADFATGLPGTSANEFRIRPNNEVLVADGDRVVRLNTSGTVIQTYAVGLTAKNLVALSLDPDNASFWVGDSGGTVYKFDIQTGANTPLTQFTTNFTTGQNAPSAINGLALIGELRAAMTPRPTCTINVTPTSGLTPLPVTASGSCTSLTGPIQSYTLFFGDGTNVAASSGSDTYTAPNTYTVTLEGTDLDGQIGFAAQTVTVTSAVSCTLAMNPTAGTAPLTTTATANCSSTTGAVQNYLFNFGDGTSPVSGSNATVSHQYSSAGNFTVSLTATDASSHTGLASAQVNVVTPGSPFCTLNVAPIAGTAPLGVTVNGTCFDPNANFSSGQISFGDGSPSFSFNNSTETAGMVPVSTTHTYELGGSYTVEIFASYTSGSAFSTQIVKVAPFVPTGPPAVGDVYISGNGGVIETHKPDGTLSNILSVGRGSDTLGGMAFDASHLLYVADPNGGDDSSSPNVWLFDANGNPKSFTNNFSTTKINTVAFGQNGTAYIGGNGTVSSSSQAAVIAVNTSGNQTPFGVTSDQPPTSTTFVKFLDLAGDQCTVYYTLATTSLKRFNVCTNSQVSPDFNLAPLPGADADELRIRPNGEVLVADNSAVIRLDANGNQNQAYGSSLGVSFYSLALDPDGRSFWTGDKTGKVYKFDIYTGQMSKQFATNLTTTGGISLLGEIRAATNPGPSCTLSVTPATVAADLPVTANGNCTGAAITNLDFGDGTVLQDTSSGTHSYTSVGTFTVTLTGTDANGVSNVVLQTVTVTANQPPTCTLTVAPASGPFPLNVTATGSCTDPENDITGTSLDFGDGTVLTNATSGTHTYSKAGTFTVKVMATDVANNVGSMTLVVTATPNLPPTCTLTVAPSSGPFPLNVTATGNCTDPENDIASTSLDFGDGTVVSGSTSGTHTYPKAGTFTVKVTATDAVGNVGSTTQVVNVTPNLPPTCTLTVAPSSGPFPLNVTATGNCTDPENDITSTSLDFGDGTVVSGSTSGTHTYSKAGTFTAKVTATDAVGNVGSTTQVVTVTQNLPPTCTLTVAPATGVAPLNVTATGNCTDPENDITSTTLDFGDGTTQTATSGTHSYTKAGVFTVTVTATDVVGQKATATQTVTVGSSLAPACTLTVTPLSGQTPLPVTATGNCTGTNTIATTVLNFGDGTTANASSGTHTYSQAGTFTVTLTATDSFGLSGSATQTVIASSNNFPQGVFVGVSGGKIMQFDSTGKALQTLDTKLGGTIADMAFDKAGNLYSVDFTAANVSKFNLTSGTLTGTFGSGYDCQPETMVFDGAGNVYVGQQGCAQTILKFDPNGNFLGSFQVTTEQQGSDDLALSADQCTMLYTSEGPSILRYDVCQKKQLAPFATGLNKALQLKILPDGGVLVADLTDIIRLNSSGQKVTTYTVPNQNCLYGIALDQDGTTFWADDYCSSNVDHIDINSGKVLSTFNTGTPSTTVFGLAIAGSGLNVAGVGNGGSLTTSPQSATLGAGQSATFTVTFTPNASSAGRTLVLSCAGLPPGLTCSFNPPTITLGAVGTSSTATLTIARTTTAALLHPSSPWISATWMGVVPAIVLMGFRSPRRRRSSMLCLALIVAATGIWASCGGGGSSPMTTTPTTTPPGSYTIIVVGNASGVQASTTVNVTAQ